MSSFKVFIILSLCLLGCTPSQDTTPPYVVAKSQQATKARILLRKQSLHIRGKTPSLEEYRILDGLGTSKLREAFLSKKVVEYLKTDQHVAKMIARLDELFRLNPASLPPEAYFEGEMGQSVNALDLLFEEVIRQNLNWDELLVRKEYRITARDKQHFLNILPRPFNVNGRYKKIKFLSDDTRVAGALSTARFFWRYRTTNLNKGRTRAAAIFRIFLCDKMRAAVVPAANEEEELLNRALLKSKIHASLGMQSQFGDRHTRDSACVSCHYKLDPLGRTYLTSGGVLSSLPSPGALVYKRADGTLLRRPVGGLADLAKAITEQPEYAQCQVSHFYRWFIDGERAPPKARLRELTQDFNRLGRRPQEFIAHLIAQPEFRSQSNIQAFTLLDTKSVLKNCYQCHNSIEELSIPDFSVFPIENAASHERWLKQLVTQLDLKHGGAKRKMPPRKSAWQPSATELALIKEWLLTGARDEASVQTVSLEKVRRWLK